MLVMAIKASLRYRRWSPRQTRPMNERPGSLPTVLCPKHDRRHYEFTTCRDCCDERQARRNAVRRPPPPPFDGKWGRCRLCGAQVRKPRVTWCSQLCVDTWNLAVVPAFHRRHLIALFGDVCWICWDEPGTYVDHVRPLWSLTDEERRELHWWLPFNTQLAGPVCHREKTAREARERALLRQAQPLERRRVASVA